MEKSESPNNFRTNEGSVYRKRHSFDLDVALVKELKVQCVQKDVPLYKAVEDAIRDYMQKDRNL